MERTMPVEEAADDDQEQEMVEVEAVAETALAAGDLAHAMTSSWQRRGSAGVWKTACF